MVFKKEGAYVHSKQAYIFVTPLVVFFSESSLAESSLNVKYQTSAHPKVGDDHKKKNRGGYLLGARAEEQKRHTVV